MSKDSNIQSILTKNEASWQSAGGDKVFFIFDCARYEIERIYIEFNRESKPEIIKLKLSEVVNVYSFKSSPISKKWRLKTCHSDESKEWKDIDLRENLIITHDNDIYMDGFKRYIKLTFSKYITEHLSVVNCRFYGKISQRIPADSEQFDAILDKDCNVNDKNYEYLEEEKEAKYDLAENKYDEDNNERSYKPKIVDCSPPAKSTHPIENMFNNDVHSAYWMRVNAFNKKETAFITIDLGNNNVNEILIRTDSYYPCGTCRILTSDHSKGHQKEWIVLYTDDNFATDIQKFEKGAIYDICDKHKKYIKLEFSNMFSALEGLYAIERLKLFGDSPFLDKKEEITMDDVINMQVIDEDLIQRYKIQEQLKIDLKAGASIAMNRGKDYNPKEINFGQEWIKQNSGYWIASASRYYMNTRFNAYIQPTMFEQEQLLKISQLQQNVADEYAHKIVKAISDDNKEKRDLEDAYQAKENEYESAKTNNKDTKIITKLKQELDAILTKLRSFHGDRMSLMEKERDIKLKEIYKDMSTENIYNCWKESVEQHPMIIPDKYSVTDYESMFKWAHKHKSAELGKLFQILANLLNKSLLKRDALIHKYHLYQLSAQRRIICDVPGQSPPSLWFLFDAKDKKLDRIEFIIHAWDYNAPTKMEVYTANEIIEQKTEDLDYVDDEDDEKKIDWTNFNMIQQIDIPNRYNELANIAWISGEDTCCNLNFQNCRYIRVLLKNQNGGAPDCKVVQFKAFVKSEDEEEIDEDAEEMILPKHRLKLIRTIEGEYIDINIRQIRRGYENVFSNVYRLKNKDWLKHTTTHDVKHPFYIFDCGDPIRKVEKFDIQFAMSDGDYTYKFDKFRISTSNTLNNDDDDDDDDEWMELFNDEMKEDKLWKQSYIDETKTIGIDCKNMRYLKFSFVLGQFGHQMTFKYLKFYTKDPDEYKWDSDRNIKNLTKKIEIIQSSPHKAGGSPKNIYNESPRECFKMKEYQIWWKDYIEDAIRDQVCCVINKVRNDGKILMKEKHFIKFLLCWKNPKHYDEILLTSKRVMNILSKPLIEEYNKLQEHKSKMLTLELDEKDRLPSDIVSNRGLLEWDYNKWYKYRKALFYPDELEHLAQEWIKLGLNLSDPEFKHLRRNGIVDKDKLFVSSDELVMEYLNLIAIKLDPSFQQTMRNLFEENRKLLNLTYPANNADLGVLSGPIKTKSRQNIKVKLDYFDKPTPQCMSVLDIVRCAIVCEDDKELCNLFQLICNRFSGKILRIKNAFDSIEKGTYGYRAVLINIAYGDDKLLPNGYQMICEVQLLLIKYYQIRQLMHLGYGIVRSEEGGISYNRQPHVVLAQDSCKFGKLDI